MDTAVSDLPQEVKVRLLGKEHAELAVFEFQGDIRELMISSFREGYLTTGNYVPDAKAVSSQGAMSIAVAGAATGAAALSTAFSSTLFMATADPATLMKLGNGVGSAVMGASGIEGQAPFIAVASSLPVVAPILAIQALSTAVMMQQFKQFDRKLDTIKTSLDELLARIEVTHVGELLAASRIVDDVYLQYSVEGSFSHDMLVRLALAEHDVRALAARFRQLVDARIMKTGEDLEQVQKANYDAYCAALSSFLELRVSYLRVCVDMQENPKSFNSSMEQLKTFLDDVINFWQQLQDRSSAVRDKRSQLEDKFNGLNRVARNLPVGEGVTLKREIAKHNTEYTATLESEREIIDNFLPLIESAKETKKALDASATKNDNSSPTLVFWKDETGEHSFVTERNLIAK